MSSLLSNRDQWSHSSSMSEPPTVSFYTYCYAMTKSCTLCSKPRDVLVRCQIDESQKWHFVCPGACWKSVSGGVEDAKGMQDEYPYYRYGGMVSC